MDMQIYMAVVATVNLAVSIAKLIHEFRNTAE